MKVSVDHPPLDLTPHQLAQALSTASGEEFARVWLELANKTKDNDALLHEWAYAMASEIGKNKYFFFRRLYELISYYHTMSEITEKRLFTEANAPDLKKPK